jgi:PAS domain S-box-containing protein
VVLAPDFQALFQSAPNLYLILDRDLRIVAVNDAYCRATKTAGEQMLGRGLFEVFPDNPDDPSASGVTNLFASLQRVLATGRPDAMPTQHYDIPRPAAEGGGFEERHWSPLNSPVFDAEGKVRWIIHRVDDVTDFIKLGGSSAVSGHIVERLRAVNDASAKSRAESRGLHRDLLAQAQALYDANSFFDAVIENIPAMIAVKDAKDLRFTLLNRAGEELTGIPRTESLGKSDFDMFPQEQAEFFVAQDRAVLASGKLHVIPEEPIQTRQYGTRILTTYKVPVFGEDGQPKYLVAMSNDITDQKRAVAALRSSEARFASLLAASPDAIIAVDATGNIVLANDHVMATYGYEPAELIGKSATILNPPAAVEDTMQRVRKVLAAPAVAGARIVQDLEGLRKDGTVFPMEASLSQQDTEDGVIVMIAIRDVTSRKAVEGQLRQAQKMEAIGNLTGGLAHDFNNLLSVVIGNLDLLREQLTKGSGMDDLAGEALSAALRGAELTRRLLAFARRQPLQPKIIDVNELIDGVGKLLSRTLGTNIEISHAPGSDVWPVLADPVQLEACLVNLAANARDAMPGGGKLQISTDNRRLDEDYVGLHPGLAAGDYTLIEVTDSGTGMPKDIVDKIFEPFFTTKSEGRGTGLGLSMVFGFMKQSNGHINVYSEEGVGTTFRLYLPRAMEAAGRTDALRTTAFALGGAETILAVEDNPGLRNLVVRQLKQLGYRCLEAEDGPSALKMLESNDVDLLFSDVIMPGGMSGYELGRIARTRWPKIKVLLTSGFPEEKINGNGKPPWNMRLLLKPYRKEDLALMLREVLAEEME